MTEELESRVDTKIVFGENAVDEIGERCRALGGNVFLVTDPGVAATGHVSRVERSLSEAGCTFRRYEDVPENPTSSDVDACLKSLGDWPAEVLLGVGGGSSIDVAKGLNFVRAGGGSMEDYWGVGKARGQLLPLIAVPTTAGTGTEVQSFALIEQDDNHQKMACGDSQAAPVLALLDPVLTVTQPRLVTACTGLDAIGHAVETAVTTKRNSISRSYSVRAFAMAQEYLPVVLEHPDDIAARGQMLQAACFAGAAIETSMLGAAHALANPLTAHYEFHHGQAVGMMLPHVVRFNAASADAAAEYAALARAAGLTASKRSDDTDDHQAGDHQAGVDALVRRLEQLLDAAGFGGSAGALRSHGVAEEALAGLAGEAAQQWTAQFNPRPVTAAELLELYARAL